MCSVQKGSTGETGQSLLNNVTNPRIYSPAGFGAVLKTELHYSSDASLKGYDQCSYLRLQNEKGDVHCALVIGKSLVSPTKAIINSKVGINSHSCFSEDRQNAQGGTWIWWGWEVHLDIFKSGSWLHKKMEHGDSTALLPTVYRRFISTHSLAHQWRCVPSNDLLIMPQRAWIPRSFCHSLGLLDPFLWSKTMQLPMELMIGDPEVRSAVVLNTKTEEWLSLVDRVSKFSSWSLAIWAVACILQCTH